MYYVAHYHLDAYYEPAEGGYYVVTHHLDGFIRCKSMKTARKWLKEEARELGYKPNTISHVFAAKHARLEKHGNRLVTVGPSRVNKFVDEEYTENKYIGEGSYLIIERSYGAHRSGYQPYE